MKLLTRSLIFVSLSSLLIACGGSGGSSDATPAVSNDTPSILESDNADTTVGNISQSEYSIQTDIATPASQQRSTSLHFESTSVVEPTQIKMSSHSFEATSAVGLVYKSQN